MTQKTALGRFDVLDHTTMAAIFGQLDIDSQIRFAASSHDLHAAFGGEIRQITGDFTTMCDAAIAGSLIFAKYLPITYYDEEICLHFACRSGNRGLVEFAISKGAHDWNTGLVCACHAGHREIGEMMLDHCDGPQKYWLSAASIGGNVELIKIILGFGCFCGEQHRALVKACRRGNMAAAKFLISIGATSFDSSYNAAYLREYWKLAEYIDQCRRK